MKKWLAVVVCIAAAACATGAGKDKPAKTPEGDAGIPAEKFPAVTLTMTESMTLGEAVNTLSDSVGGNLAVMAGLDNRIVPPLAFKKTPFETVASTLASVTNCKIQSCPNYIFISPAAPGYEAVLELSLAGQLDAAHQSLTVTTTIGFDMPLYEAFFLLSRVMQTTIIADNPVAAATTGTVALSQAPLQDALEALLKSARVPKQGLKIVSTPEYIFLAAQDNPAASGPLLLNAESLSPEQNAILEKKVSVVLPETPKDPAHIEIPHGAVPLGGVLDSLSAQMGVKVSVDKGLDDLPVNPCVMNNVRVRTAMELLIRQWPLAKYGYALNGQDIVVKFKGG